VAEKSGYNAAFLILVVIACLATGVYCLFVPETKANQKLGVAYLRDDFIFSFN
jgi:hypothetical protein